MRKLIALILIALAPCVAWGATFGLTADNSGGSYTEITANRDILTKVTLSEDGAATSVTYWIRGNSIAWKGVIYADDNGEPGTLMGATGAGTSSTTAQFMTASFATGVGLTAGVYWTGLIPNGTIQCLENSGGANHTYCAANGDLNSYSSPVSPAPFRNFYQDGFTANCYVTYTAGGGGTVPTSTCPAQVIILGNSKVYDSRYGVFNICKYSKYLV